LKINIFEPFKNIDGQGSYEAFSKQDMFWTLGSGTLLQKNELLYS